MQLTIATPRLCSRDGQGLVNVEIAREALRRGHSLRCVCTELEDELAQHPMTQWTRAGSQRLPTQLLKSLAYVISASVLLGLRRSGEVRLANGFCFVQRADLLAVHFLHCSWFRSPFHNFRARRGAARAYYWLHEALHAGLERLALARARRVVAVSERVRDELIDHDLCTVPISVIPNGVDPQRFTDGPADRERFGLPAEATVALFAGDLRSARKNLDVVLRAFSQVPEIYLAVAGFTNRSAYPAMVSSLGLSERVRFVDYQVDMPALLRAADFVVYPSHYDPFGLVVLEALAAKRPVIVSRAAGVSATVNENCAIVLEEATNAAVLADSMRRLAASPELRRRMGEAGRQLVEQLTWRVVAARYLDLLESLSRETDRALPARSCGGAAG